ncbi:MAG: L-2-amino-thiazoline-4-carboxylic acid hydrolase [Bradyrhizobium sp.]|uniref:L-2-amino-thiazoline-4-carboxylic acid hydrolase n=1 Tax=Bradyrhizobium sp. TaxID=376 RepID=UPI0035363366
MTVSVIEQAKIQAQVLIPLVKAMQAELGKEKADRLVRKALGDLYRRFGEEFWKSRSEPSLGKSVASAFKTYAQGDALDYRVSEQSPDAASLDVTRCRYAEFYKALGEPELGFLLVCMSDFAVAEGFGPDVKLTRTQTIMQGAPHCDFRYRRAGSTE